MQCVKRFNNGLLFFWQAIAILKIQYYRLINFLLKQQFGVNKLKNSEVIMANLTQLESDDIDYDPNNLLDTLIKQLHLKNDAALSRALEVAPPVISKSGIVDYQSVHLC